MMPARKRAPSPAPKKTKTPCKSPETVAATPSYGDPEWQAQFLTRRRLLRARIPQRFAHKSLETFSARDAVRKGLVRDARAYLESFTAGTPWLNKNGNTSEPTTDRGRHTRGLIMMGPPGCGKSHLAVSILREVVRKGFTGLYYNSPDLMRDLRATIDRNSDVTEDELLEEITTTDLLVFDDIGAERMSEYVLDRFYLVFNERYEGCKPVVITTNLTREQFEDRLGHRIVSRIVEMCSPMTFPNEDWRRRGSWWQAADSDDDA